MVADAKFLFVVCQVGAESALKGEMARAWPAFHFAFSRPGFVTFKLPVGLKLADDFELGLILGRAAGFCLGKVSADDAESAARRVSELVAGQMFDHLHAWERDPALPGDRGFEPGVTPLAAEVGGILATEYASHRPEQPKLPVNRLARAGQRILDCVLVEPNEWWLGWHVATAPPTRWPGGVPLCSDIPETVVSRAYLKMVEALAWSRLPVKPGDHCAEIGSAPGGSAQALLDRGLHVMGIDPAEMDEVVTAHPHFVHVRKRVADLKRREFRQIKWLFADSNIAPAEALEDVEAIVTHREVRIRGMLLTLKLSDWALLETVPALVERVRSWGYQEVATRQLAFNRREICLAAHDRRFAAISAPRGGSSRKAGQSDR